MPPGYHHSDAGGSVLRLGREERNELLQEVLDLRERHHTREGTGDGENLHDSSGDVPVAAIDARHHEGDERRERDNRLEDGANGSAPGALHLGSHTSSVLLARRLVGDLVKALGLLLDLLDRLARLGGKLVELVAHGVETLLHDVEATLESVDALVAVADDTL